jgi:hypothetical protein
LIKLAEAAAASLNLCAFSGNFTWQLYEFPSDVRLMWADQNFPARAAIGTVAQWNRANAPASVHRLYGDYGKSHTRHMSA